MSSSYRQQCLREKGSECARCEGEKASMDRILVHHIDGDRQNNSPDNLEPLCGACHQLWHKNFDDPGDFEEFKESFPSPELDGWERWLGKELDDLEAALERGDRAAIQERMAALRESIDDA